MDHNTLTWNGRGWAEGAPRECPNGHPLVGGKVLVGSHVCSCEIHHHRTHRCRECDAITYTPPLGVGCQDNAFDGRAATRAHPDL